MALNVHQDIYAFASEKESTLGNDLSGDHILMGRS
jgi:hypothetical protein